MKVSVQLDDRDLRQGISALKKKFPYAVKRALARTTTTTKAAMAQAIREDTYLSSRFIKDEIKVVISENSARLEIQGRRVPLITFGARGPEPSKGEGRGVSWRNPGSKRERDPQAFIATMRSGHRGVFKRVGATSRKAMGPSRSTGKSTGAWSYNLPILELYGPSLVQVFEKFMPMGAQTANEALIKNLKHEISFALSKE